MPLLVGCYYYYFAMLEEVCGVELHFQALIHNSVLSAQVGEVTLFFSFLTKLMFLLILMLRSYCGESVTVRPLILLLKGLTLKSQH